MADQSHALAAPPPHGLAAGIFTTKATAIWTAAVALGGVPANMVAAPGPIIAEIIALITQYLPQLISCIPAATPAPQKATAFCAILKPAIETPEERYLDWCVHIGTKRALDSRQMYRDVGAQIEAAFKAEMAKVTPDDATAMMAAA